MRCPNINVNDYRDVKEGVQLLLHCGAHGHNVTGPTDVDGRDARVR